MTTPHPTGPTSRSARKALKAGPGALGGIIVALVVASAVAGVALATVLNVLGLLFAAVAATAGVAAVLYARETIVKSLEGAAAEATRHSEQLKELRAVNATALTAHKQEMRDRKLAFEREQVVRRIEQLQRVADIAHRIQATAMEEVLHPEVRRDLESGSWHETPVTRLPPLQLLIRVEGTGLTMLGGPHLNAHMPRFGGVSPDVVANDAGDLLLKIQQLMTDDESLKLPGRGVGPVK